MSLSLLDLVNGVSGELGLSRTTTVVASTTAQTVHLLALAQRLGLDLIREFEWRRLVKQYVFQTTPALTGTADTTEDSLSLSNISFDTSTLTETMIVAGNGIPAFTEILGIDSSSALTMTQPASVTATGIDVTFAYQDYALPTDFDRMVSETNWDRTNFWMNRGAQSSQSWATLQGGFISSGDLGRYRLYGNKLRILPALTDMTNMVYEYVSTYWVIGFGNDGVANKESLSADDDTVIFPDDLMRAGLKYYFLKAKKLDYGEEKVEFYDALSTRKAQDQPQTTKSLALSDRSDLSCPTIPQGNWPY